MTSLCAVTVNVISANCDNNNQLQLPSQVDHKKVTSSAGREALKKQSRKIAKAKRTGREERNISNEAHCIYSVRSTRCLKDYNCSERDTERELKMSWLTHKGREQGKLCPGSWESFAPENGESIHREKSHVSNVKERICSLKIIILIIIETKS